MVEGARLESVYAAYAVSGVQIPISPPEYYFDIFNKFSWSGRLGLNQRPHGPQPCALPLRHAPINPLYYKARGSLLSIN